MTTNGSPTAAPRARRGTRPDTRPGDRRGGTLEAGLDILEALAARPGGLGVSDLARELDADKGNVHRLLQVLARRGYVAQDPTSRRWSAAAELVALAGGVLRQLDVRVVAQPVLASLVSDTGETAHLALRTATGGVYIAQERPAGRVSVETEIGGQPVLHATATGKALLAATGDPAWRALVHPPLRRFTDRTVTTVHGLAEALAATRQRGYAVDDEEYQEGIRCLAAPVLDLQGVVVASIGVSGPADRVTKRRLAELGRTVRAAADAVTTGLGGG